MVVTWIGRYKEKSLANLLEAERCLDAGLHRAAISRAYYSLYQATNAWMKHKGGYPEITSNRNNWRHEDVNDSWAKVLGELCELGIDPGYDADIIYNTAQSFRVRVDYKTTAEPTAREASKVVDSCKQAVDWLSQALRKAGH